MVCVYTLWNIYTSQKQVCRLRLPHDMRKRREKNRTFWRFFFSFALFSFSLSLLTIDEKSCRQSESDFFWTCLFPLFLILFCRASTLLHKPAGLNVLAWPDVFKHSLTHTLCCFYPLSWGRHCLSWNCKYICEFRAAAVDVDDRRRRGVSLNNNER